jgi:hypothetical protein
MIKLATLDDVLPSVQRCPFRKSLLLTRWLAILVNKSGLSTISTEPGLSHLFS